MYLSRSVFNDFDRVFDGFFGGAWNARPTRYGKNADDGGDAAQRLTPAVESYTRDGKLVLRAEMPGVDNDGVNVTVENGRMTVTGEKRFERTDDQSDYLVRETRYGRFERTFTLPEFVDAEQVQATLNNGVLEISMPLPEKPAARRIPVNGAGDERPAA